MTAAIEIEGLRKTYRGRRGARTAIDGLDLSVPVGGVFGFLGPNGSGKTTTIRCLLGLARATSGRTAMLGSPGPATPDTLRRVGAIVEAPALFATMTGRENLRLLAATDRIGDRKVDETLEQVGLEERSHDLVRKYSLGMRQKLALAAALLKDPALLILDEPANGLDPAGIRQVRTLVRSLAAEGRTVFVSSHVLAEVEQTCDAVAIVHHGRCVAQGRVADVVNGASRGDVMLVQLDDLDAGAHALQRAGLPVDRHDGTLRVAVAHRHAALITQALASERLWVTAMRREERSLEDLFLELTADVEPTEDAVR